MRARDFLLETDTKGFVKKFIPWVAHQLEIDRLPPIELLDKPFDTTFGAYDPENKSIRLVTGGRHPVDVLRTLAHELTHYKQDVEGRLQSADGATGSKEENEANANAGIMMRNFAAKNPEFFGVEKSSFAEDQDKEFQMGHAPHNPEKLDALLAQAVDMVLINQKRDSEKYGMVAACVYDPEGRAVFGVNTATNNGKRRHAEREAIDNYKNEYNTSIPAGSIIITTLSPCNEPMRDRYGEDCTKLINGLGIKKVYCGYIDPSQSTEHADFELDVTKNDKLAYLCKQLAATFL
jgi:pyrimidine deaminase RibD-like protein